MEPLAIILIGFVLGVAGYALGYRDALKEKNLPYRWECMHEGCKFNVKSNDLNFVMAFADRHSEEEHKD